MWFILILNLLVLVCAAPSSSPNYYRNAGDSFISISSDPIGPYSDPGVLSPIGPYMISSSPLGVPYNYGPESYYPYNNWDDDLTWSYPTKLEHKIGKYIDDLNDDFDDEWKLSNKLKKKFKRYVDDWSDEDRDDDFYWGTKYLNKKYKKFLKNMDSDEDDDDDWENKHLKKKFNKYINDWDESDEIGGNKHLKKKFNKFLKDWSPEADDDDHHGKKSKH